MVRKTGFDYVEFGSWAQHDIKKIKSLLEENRLQLGCFSGDKDYNLIDPAHCKEFLEYFKRSVEAAHFLDCKNLVIHSNALGEEGRMCTDGNDLNDRTKIACATKNLLEISKIAEAEGLYLQVEPVSTYAKPGYYMTTSDSAADIIRVVGSPNVKLLYDIYHMQIMEGNVIDHIQKYHQYFSHIHTGGVPGRAEIDETQELYYPAIMKAIVETGYKGFVGQEFVPKQEDKIASLEKCIRICDV